MYERIHVYFLIQLVVLNIQGNTSRAAGIHPKLTKQHFRLTRIGLPLKTTSDGFVSHCECGTEGLFE